MIRDGQLTGQSHGHFRQHASERRAVELLGAQLLYLTRQAVGELLARGAQLVAQTRLLLMLLLALLALLLGQLFFELAELALRRLQRIEELLLAAAGALFPLAALGLELGDQVLDLTAHEQLERFEAAAAVVAEIALLLG